MNGAGDVWCVRIASWTFGPFTREAAEKFKARHGGEHAPLWAADERDLADPGKRLARDLAMIEARDS